MGDDDCSSPSPLSKSKSIPCDYYEDLPFNSGFGFNHGESEVCLSFLFPDKNKAVETGVKMKRKRKSGGIMGDERGTGLTSNGCENATKKRKGKGFENKDYIYVSPYFINNSFHHQHVTKHSKKREKVVRSPYFMDKYSNKVEKVIRSPYFMDKYKKNVCGEYDTDVKVEEGVEGVEGVESFHTQPTCDVKKGTEETIFTPTCYCSLENCFNDSKGREKTCSLKKSSNDSKGREKIAVDDEAVPFPNGNLKEEEELHVSKIGKVSLDDLFSEFRYTGAKLNKTPVQVSVAATNQTKRQKPPVLKAAQKQDIAYLRKTADNSWIPPPSPFNLLQEAHASDPWRVLVICMLLNLTTGKQVT